MSHFVVFLRAINVGSHTVTKAELQEIFNLSFQDVSIYKQSGNLILKTDAADAEEIKRKVENRLREALGYEVAAFVRTIPQLKAVVKLEPFKGHDKKGTSFLVTFLSNAPLEFPLKLPLTIPKSTAQVISVKGNEVFSMTHGGGEGGLPNSFLESKLKLKATTRNMNTVTEILKKFPERSERKTESMDED